MTSEEVLRLAAKRIRARGWASNMEEATKTRKLCAWTAIPPSAGGEPARLLVSRIGGNPDDSTYYVISRWNDAQTSVEPVLAALEGTT